MAKDIVTKAEILGGEIDVRANFGQTVKVTVSPDPYMGNTEVTPSDQTQVLQTKKKFVQDDITVYPAPTEYLSTDHNGTFTPSDGKVGFSQVDVNVNPDLRPLSVSENGTYEPEGFDGYSEVIVDVGSDVLYELDLTKSITEVKEGVVKTFVESGSGHTAPSITPTGLAFTEATQRLYLGDLDLIGKTLDIDVASMDFQGSTIRHMRLLTNGITGTSGLGLLIYRANAGGNTGWSAFEGSWLGKWFSDDAENSNRNIFSGKTISLKFYDDNKIELYLDGVLKGTQTIALPQTQYAIGACANLSQDSGDQIYNAVISAVRIRKNT